MTNEQLFDLLSFEDGLQAVEIISQEETKNDGLFIRARLFYGDGEMTVSFVHYANLDWIFTPCDWYGKQPETIDEIKDIDWRVNDTETEGIIFEGLPMLAPWTPDPKEVRRGHRKRIGKALREAREEAGMSIRAVAEATGIDKGIISRTEAGRANTTIDTINLLADCYGYRLELMKMVPCFASVEDFGEFLRKQREEK